MAQQRPEQSRTWRNVFWLLLLFLQPLLFKAVEIKWTPADEDNGSSYSTKDRQLLLNLDQHISTSSNPQDALQKVAASNEMDPYQLQEILMENRRFAEQHGLKGGAIQNRQQPLILSAFRVVASLLTGLWQMSLRHPRWSTTLLVVSCISLWIAWNAPRNGVPLETRLGNRGPTTLFVPPTGFLERTFLERNWWKADASLNAYHVPAANQEIWVKMDAARKRDNTKMQSKKKATNQVCWYSDVREVEDGKALLKAAEIETVVDLKTDLFAELEGGEFLLRRIVHSQIQGLFNDPPQLTEFAHEHKIRFLTSSRDPHPCFGVLLVPGLGRWGGLGYIPVELESDIDSDDSDSSTSADQTVLGNLALPILTGTYWGGQGIYIRILDNTGKGSQNPVYVVEVAWIANYYFSRSRIKLLPKKLVERIVESICASVTNSLETRTRQAFARQAQSTRLADRAKLSASARRKMRSSRERQLEEMAADRRRRRFIQNPNQGRYRPSGERMQSPNNAIYK